jgi:nucleoid DNA-binding protein
MLGDMELGHLHATAKDSRNRGLVELQTFTKVDIEIRAAQIGQRPKTKQKEHLRVNSHAAQV